MHSAGDRQPSFSTDRDRPQPTIFPKIPVFASRNVRKFIKKIRKDAG